MIKRTRGEMGLEDETEPLFLPNDDHRNVDGEREGEIQENTQARSYGMLVDNQ